MRHYMNFILTVRACLLVLLTFMGWGTAQADSTFFPEGSPEAKEITLDEGSEAIKEWAELKPSKKEKTASAAPKKTLQEVNPIPLLSAEIEEETQAPIVSKEEPKPTPVTNNIDPKSGVKIPTVAQKQTDVIQASPPAVAVKPDIKAPIVAQEQADVIQAPPPAVAVKPDIKAPIAAQKQTDVIQASTPAVAVKPDIKAPIAAQEQKDVVQVSTPPAPVVDAVKPDVKAPIPAQEQKIVNQVSASTVPAASAKQQPLQLTKVAPHPKAAVVQEAPQAPAGDAQATAVVAYVDVANDRAPLGILEPTQEVQSQRWYIYSSAIRGLKNSSDSLQIVSLEGAAPNRGQQIKDLLVEMGIEAEKVHLIHAKGDENQKGIIYLFSGK